MMRKSSNISAVRLLLPIVGVLAAVAAQNVSADGVPAKPDVFERALEKMKAQLGGSCSYCRMGIFVCGGNMPEKDLESIALNSVVKPAEKFWKMFFDTKPSYPIYVYLMRGKQAYVDLVVQHFGGKPPGTPFGFYVHGNTHALVMNISTGTGTLVHELTHALTWPDFPRCPTWFFEGLGSLYECCDTSGADIIGFKNWRYEELYKTMQAGKLTPLRQLMTGQFLGKRTSLHYAQARYLCMYMQEKGVLKSFYKQFRDNVGSDPSGVKTLEKVFGKSLEEIEKEWLTWVASIKSAKQY